MAMTILNFETFFRAAKVQKAREMFLRDQVIELRKAKIVWVGRIKIGLYKVQINLLDIKLGDAKCTCDSRSRSGYCEHKLAVLFALRKELDLYPALTNSSPKLLPSDRRLHLQMEEMNHSENAPRKKDVDLFGRTANAVLKEAGNNIQSGNYRPAVGDCIEVIKQVADMNVLLNYDYADEDKLTSKAFDLLGQALEKITNDELLEHIAHDMRVESLRNYRTNYDIWKKWMELLKPISNQGNRHDKFMKVLDTLNRIEQNHPEVQY